MEEAELVDVPPQALLVEILERLLDEIRGRVVASGSVECAGLLFGKLLRDPRRGAGVLQVTQAVDVQPGRDGASAVHFAFGADSLVAARRAASRPGEAALPVGWYHSHPACTACAKRETCSAQMVYFSSDDVEVHSSAFPSAYQIGLVAGKVSDRPVEEPGFRLYGWVEGRVEELGYRLIREPSEPTVSQWVEPSGRGRS
jgi:proteasome lid subunit RPN8/RPN11